VYLDGVQLVGDTGNGPNLDIVTLSFVGGIEYYSPSEVPVQYKTSGTMHTPQHSAPGATATGMSSNGASTSPSCGVMLIWTKP
jgi:hypothetical protein